MIGAKYFSTVLINPDSDFANIWPLGWGLGPGTGTSVGDLLAASCQSRGERRVSCTDTSTLCDFEFSVLNSLDIDHLAVYFAQWLTLFEWSVLTWHLAEDVHAMCMLYGPIP